MKLTTAQWNALDLIGRDHTHRIPFRTGEVLRRHGLAERQTLYVLRAEYGTQRGVFKMYDLTEDRPHPVHDWWITRAGRDVLLLRPAE